MARNKKKAKQYQMQRSTFCYALWCLTSNRRILLPALLSSLFLISWKQYLKAQTQFFLTRAFCLGDVVYHNVHHNKKHIMPACITIADAKSCYSKYVVSQIFTLFSAKWTVVRKRWKGFYSLNFWGGLNWLNNYHCCSQSTAEP